MLIVVVECRQQNAAVAPLQPFVQQELVCKTGRNPKIGRATSQPFQSAVNLQKETHQLFVTCPISSISGQVQGASIIQPLEAWQRGPQAAEVSSTQYVLSRLILRTGGVTFLAFMFFAVFFITFQHFELICLVPLCMKFGCLLTNVAWYWISAEHHIREATDKKLKLVLSLHGCLYAFYSPEEE